MLNTDTKQNILRARNILVGVVPMPSAQIEQITYAMLYKFMDDMDQQSIAIGGKASFFEGEWGKYAWSNMFDPRVGGFELHSLYTDALQAIPRNPNIPQFIRTIFKNAILPYRNPETLKLFLKIINEFEFTTADHFGDAFEHLLQTWGSQGDAGQFLTPRHIINFMVEVVDPQKDESILDPACGTAGFLISAFRHILDQNTQKVPGDQLSNDERTALMGNLTGYDISGEMVRLALTNLYLHGFPNPRVLEYDTLTSEDHWDQYFNVILANPPFMTPTGGIRPHKRFGVQANRAEVLFVDYIAEHLTPDGRAAIIVPEGIIFQSGKAYKQLRKMLVEQNYLWAVASLPAGVFNPYSGVKTSILFLDKALARKTDQILFVKIENDGFSLGANRTEIDKNDLPDSISLMKTYQEKIIKKGTKEFTDIAVSEGSINFLVVEKNKISENNEFNLIHERYLDSARKLITDFQFTELREVADILHGITFGKNDQVSQITPSALRIATTKAAQKNGITESDLYFVKPELLREKKKLLHEGDILVSTANSLNLLGRTTYIAQHYDYVSFGAFMTLLRPINEKIMPIYLLHCLRSEIAQKYYLSHAKTTTNISNLTSSDLGSFQIPLPPLDVQREIVDEIEACQRVIDGARMVVDNWKPNLAHELELARKSAGVDEWPRVKLGEVLGLITSGATPLGGKSMYFQQGVLFIRSQNVLWGKYDFSDAAFVSQETHEQMKRSQVRKNDVLLNITGASIGRTAVYTKDDEANVNQHVTILRCKDSLLPFYLMNSILTNEFQTRIMAVQSGASRQALNYEQIKQLSIQLPPKEIQQKIIEKIESERTVIQSNHKLIEIYEEKIRQIIAQVWEG